MSKYKIQVIKRVHVHIEHKYVASDLKHTKKHINVPAKDTYRPDQGDLRNKIVESPQVQRLQQVDLGRMIKDMHQKPRGKLLGELTPGMASG
jgi:hypothetical protein